MGGDKFSVYADMGLKNIMIFNENKTQILNEAYLEGLEDPTTVPNDNDEDKEEASGTEDFQKALLILPLQLQDPLSPQRSPTQSFGPQNNMSDEVIQSRTFYGKPVVLATNKSFILQKNAQL